MATLAADGSGGGGSGGSGSGSGAAQRWCLLGLPLRLGAAHPGSSCQLLADEVARGVGREETGTSVVGEQRSCPEALLFHRLVATEAELVCGSRQKHKPSHGVASTTSSHKERQLPVKRMLSSNRTKLHGHLNGAGKGSSTPQW